MTREEAKHIVDVAFSIPLAVRKIGEDRTYLDDEVREAKKIAIKAISTLDKIIAYCKKSPNAILPEDVLSLIRGEDVEIETDYGYEKFEPKTGHWIIDEGENAVCSCCNRNNVLYGDFCKWCGAKMVEPQESEDIK